MKAVKTNKVMHDGNWVKMQSSKGLSMEFGGCRVTFLYDSVKPINELENSIEKGQFKTFLNRLEITKDLKFETYSSKNKLRVGYIDELKKVNIFSYGEKQPGRYQVILEGQIYK